MFISSFASCRRRPPPHSCRTRLRGDAATGAVSWGASLLVMPNVAMAAFGREQRYPHFELPTDDVPYLAGTYKVPDGPCLRV